MILIFTIFLLGSMSVTSSEWLNITNAKSESFEEISTSSAFRFKPPELELQFLHLNINGLSIGAQISTEFSNLAPLVGGILLHSAVNDNNLNMIESLIDNGADLNTDDIDGLTPLYKALKSDQNDAIRLLVNAGANVNFCSRHKNSLLHISVRRNDYDVLKKLIKLGANIDVVNDEDVTPLYVAAETGNQPMIEALVESKANKNLKSEKGKTLLHIAVYRGRLDVVKQLIELKADIDTYDNEGSTPLYTAVILNHPGIIKILLDNGANASSVSSNGTSLLHMAILEEKIDVIQKLITIGANTKALNSESLTPLHLAIKTNKISAIKTMLKINVDINEKSSLTKDYPLHFAVTHGTADTVKTLLKGGAETNVFNKDGLTPLVLAIFQDKQDLIDLLYEADPIVNYEIDDEQNTPLHLAVLKSDLLSVEKLLKRGARVDPVNREGLTPLCKAALLNYKNIIKLLKKNGANINYKTAFGDTPLHLAVSNKSVSSVITLIELGAEKNYFDSKRLTPLCKAITMNASNVINALLVKGAYVNAECNKDTPLILAIKNSTLSILIRLLNLGAKTNYNFTTLACKAVEADNPEIMMYFLSKETNVDQTVYDKLLLLAASSGSPAVIRQLMQFEGTVVDAEDEVGLTPIWLATMNNHYEAMKVLIENRADFKRTINHNKYGLDFRNWSLLHEAAFNGIEEAVDLLLNSGIYTDVRDGRGWTPLHYAAAQHNMAVVKKLIESGANIKAETLRGELPINLLKHRRSYEPIMITWLTPKKAR